MQEMPEFMLPWLLYVLTQHPDFPEQVGGSRGCCRGAGEVCLASSMHPFIFQLRSWWGEAGALPAGHLIVSGGARAPPSMFESACRLFISAVFVCARAGAALNRPKAKELKGLGWAAPLHLDSASSSAHTQRHFPQHTCLTPCNHTGCAEGAGAGWP